MICVPYFNDLSLFFSLYLSPDALIPEPADALPANVAECAALDCMPAKQQARTVRSITMYINYICTHSVLPLSSDILYQAVIRQEKKNAMSSGTMRTRGWIWHMKNEGQWTNPLTVRERQNQLTPLF
jgi:hypothetical protein